MRSSAHLSITAQESSGNPTAHLAAGNPTVAGTSNFGLDTHLLLSSLPLEKTTNMYDSTAARTADADNSTVNDTIGDGSITNAAAVKTEPVNTPPGGTVDISTPHAEVFSTGSVTGKSPGLPEFLAITSLGTYVHLIVDADLIFLQSFPRLALSPSVTSRIFQLRWTTLSTFTFARPKGRMGSDFTVHRRLQRWLFVDGS